MGSSRFYGKPLHHIGGRAMLDHVYHAASQCNSLDKLVVATCDEAIKDHCEKMGFPVIMTSKSHVRALDRVQEASEIMNCDNEDIIVCIQGDEPMVVPELIDSAARALIRKSNKEAIVIGLPIIDYEVFMDPNTVKIVFDEQDRVVYTSRSPVPYMKQSDNLRSGKVQYGWRIYGVFSFVKHRLDEFSKHRETVLEQIEACDSNRIIDMDFHQYIEKFQYFDSFSVDCIEDALKVERAITG